MNKNIKIAYILGVCNSALFWFGTWIFFYLRFTDYGGIGFLESIMIFILIISEVPSGALTDLLGKKKALLLSFLLLGIGNIAMAFSPSYIYLILSASLVAIGNAFYSGTSEALVFDSLKEKGENKKYDKAISNLRTFELLAISFASVVGGFIYSINPSYPFLFTGIFAFVGVLFALLLKEPKIDTEKFSFVIFLKHNKEGLRELTKSKEIKRQSVILLFISFFLVIIYEILSDALAFEFGFKSNQLGILWAVLAFNAAIISQFTPRILKRFKENSIFLYTGIVIALTLMISPYLGLITGAIIFIIRASFGSVFSNATSVIINNNTESKYRVTTISTFNLIKNIPYVIVAYFIGHIMDIFSARIFAFNLGLMLLIFVGFWVLFKKNNKK